MENSILTRVLNSLGYEKRSTTVGPTNSLGLQYGFSTSPVAIYTSLQLSAVYRCVEVISDAIASQTWEYLEYKDTEGWVSDPFHDVAYLLNNEPHPSMSKFTLMKTFVAKVLLEGFGFIEIGRSFDMGSPVSLSLINDYLKIFKRDDGSLYYEVGEPGKERTVDGQNMIHVLNFTYDGINGISTLKHAANTMGLAFASESSAKGFFLSGANMSGILTVLNGKVTAEKAKLIKESWASAFNITSGQPGGIAVMEGGMEFKPVTVDPKDAQMLETRMFNIEEICRFFGVPPIKVFANSDQPYSNIELYQLGFVTDAVAPLDTKIESEFNRKLLRPSLRRKTRLNLNLEDLLRGNMDSTANYVSKMFQCGGYTVNEVRAKVGNPKVKGGDKALAPLNLIPVDTPIKQNKIDKNINVEDNGKSGDTNISE